MITQIQAAICRELEKRGISRYAFSQFCGLGKFGCYPRLDNAATGLDGIEQMLTVLGATLVIHGDDGEPSQTVKLTCNRAKG